MNSSIAIRPRTFTIAIIICSTALLVIGRAERVGYQFSGQMIPPLPLPGIPVPDHYNIFNVVVPVDAPIRGTFSYDTTAAGVDSVDNSKVFKQGIHGGLTFDILGSGDIPLLHVVASQFNATATNDFLPDHTPSAIDAFEVDTVPPPAPILANGASVTKSSATLRIPFSWDDGAFIGPDQPFLWPDLPTFSYTTIGFIGSNPTKTVQNTLGSFELHSLKKLPSTVGDYNFNGTIDDGDYSEWRDAFGATDANHHYADGNNDGVVSSADYIVWRNAQSHGSATGASVPEPSTIFIAIVASLGVASGRRRRK